MWIWDDVSVYMLIAIINITLTTSHTDSNMSFPLERKKKKYNFFCLHIPLIHKQSKTSLSKTSWRQMKCDLRISTNKVLQLWCSWTRKHTNAHGTTGRTFQLALYNHLMIYCYLQGSVLLNMIVTMHLQMWEQFWSMLLLASVSNRVKISQKPAVISVFFWALYMSLHWYRGRKVFYIASILTY